MAYFARDCLQKMDVLCEKLETSLGPDTSDLKLRIGIHSGAVTGGVLRGKRSRFQLFGDVSQQSRGMVEVCSQLFCFASTVLPSIIFISFYIQQLLLGILDCEHGSFDGIRKGGSIHLSEATAQLIEIAGKSAWLIKRETHIAAKGKQHKINVHAQSLTYYYRQD
jgi:Adenylate and Guanylate cyclase catalytic domain